MTINNNDSDTDLYFFEYLLHDEESNEEEDEEIMIVFLAAAATANNLRLLYSVGNQLDSDSHVVKLFQEGLPAGICFICQMLHIGWSICQG